jgi:hypothetical protein
MSRELLQFSIYNRLSKQSSQRIFHLCIHGYKMEFDLGRYLSSHSSSGFVDILYFIFWRPSMYQVLHHPIRKLTIWHHLVSITLSFCTARLPQCTPSRSTVRDNSTLEDSESAGHSDSYYTSRPTSSLYLFRMAVWFGILGVTPFWNFGLSLTVLNTKRTLGYDGWDC